MELFATIVLALVTIAFGIALLIFGFKGLRVSQARDARSYKRGRI